MTQRVGKRGRRGVLCRRPAFPLLGRPVLSRCRRVPPDRSVPPLGGTLVSPRAGVASLTWEVDLTPTQVQAAMGLGVAITSEPGLARFVSSLLCQLRKRATELLKDNVPGKKIFLMYPFLIKIKCVEFLKFRHSCLLSVSKGNCLPRGPGDVCSPRSCSVLSLAELSVIYMGPSPNFVVNFY